MQYSLYDYYKNSFLTLDEILKHYIDHFYLNKYGRDKVDKIISKTLGCDRMKELFGRSIQNRDFPERTPDFNDFSIAIAKTFWFLTQSNETIALATLVATVEWNKTINSHFLIIDEEEFRNNILNIFRKLNICEEMSEHDYRVMTDPYVYSRMASTTPVHPSVQKVSAKLKIRTAILNKINELNLSTREFDTMSYDSLREYVVKFVYNDLNMIGSDTRRLATKFGIDLKDLIYEVIDKSV